MLWENFGKINEPILLEQSFRSAAFSLFDATAAVLLWATAAIRGTIAGFVRRVCQTCASG